ncbi:MAG TPA: DUF6531 domain-containing protein [Acidimicrobiales bacterium]|nr:DUF6531 domain-containing protein [Acidimicrobiales bacterium]
MALLLSLFAVGSAAQAAGKPTVALDPDDNFSFGLHDGTTYRELPITHDIAQAVQAKLPSICDSDVIITRGTSQDFVPRSERAAQMETADVSVTLSLNGLTGTPWGVEAEGGSSAYTTSAPGNLAFGTELLNELHAHTGRPTAPVNEAPTKEGLTLPYPEFASLPGSYAQIFMLYIDHNYDWPVIQSGRDLLVNAVVTAVGRSLQSKGFKCVGTFPSPPSTARLRQLRNLGYQNFLRYGADPVSMSTGNFVTSERVFTLSGVGSQVVDLSLNYNAQSSQDSPVGVGWQFAYGSFLQQYSDGSVGLSLADGRAFLFVPNGSGGYNTPAGAFANLTEVDASTFRWASTTGASMTFTQDASGRGMLTSTTDRQGNAVTLTYDGSGSAFPRLVGITDQAGQHVAVISDSHGRITSLTRPDGATWRLGYSDAGDLVSITSARGTVRRFGYDDQHRMTSQVGQDGVTFLTNGYDEHSRVVRQTNAFDQIRTIAYDDANRLTTYTDTAGAKTVYRWNALGMVTEVEDALGGVTKTSYNGDLQPVGETDPLGHASTIAYDASGQVAGVADPLGKAVTSTYNSAGDLTSRTDTGGPGGTARTIGYTVNGQGLPTTVTNPDGTTQTRAYNPSGDVTSATDENGAVTAYGYDGRGNTTSVTDPLGRTTHMTYDLANRLTSVTDPLGRTTAYQYDENDNLVRTTYPNGSSERRSYDVNDQLSNITDRRGAVTSYAYDAELNVVAVTLANEGVVRHTFDGENRLTSTTDPLGNKTLYSLDPLGRRVAVTDAAGHTWATAYDAAGMVRVEADPTGATTTFVRDANGRVLSVADPTGGVTANEWDSVGRLTAATDPLGRRTAYTYDFRDRLTTTTDPAGGVTTNRYDAAGRLTSRRDAAGATTTFTLDAAGQVTKVTDALGGITSHAYDAAGNRTNTTDANGHVNKTGYDSMDQPVSRTNGDGETSTVRYDAGGLVVAEIDPLGNRTSHVHGAIGDRTATTDPLGRVTRFGFDLNRRQTSRTAPDGIVTAYGYDNTGNLTSVTENSRPGQPSSSTVNVTTAYRYDSRKLLTETTDANGAVTGQAYDARGLLTSTTDPLGKVTGYRYDAAGTRSSRTDANGVTTSYSYDSRDLLVRRAYPDGSQDTFDYDAVGRQLRATNAVGAVATAYDALGRPTSVTDAAGKTLRYGYDAVGNRTSLILPDGRTLAYQYDAADRLTRLTSPLGDLVTAYDDAGRPTLVSRPNGTTTTVGFDDADELIGLATSGGGSPLASFAYTYDPAGNVATRAQNLGGTATTTTYTYDPLRRLTNSAGGPLPSTYSYDAVGNRLTWSAPDDPTTPKPNDPFTQTNAFNVAGQVVTSTKARQNGNATFTDVTTNAYDANGNRVLTSTEAQAPGQSTATAYAYDFENRLVSSGPAGDRSKRGNGDGQRDYSRSYDALGRLVREVRNRTSTTWTADGLNPILASDTDTTLYLRDAGGQLQGEQMATDDPAWYVTDALGSILGATNGKAKLDNATAYSDFGVNLGKSPFRMGFGGEVADPLLPGNGIGNDTPVLSHYFARSYEPGTGSWLQADPIKGDIRTPDTLARYQFVADNPSTNTDLLGFLTVSTASSWSGTLRVGSASTATWNGSLQGSSSAASILQPTVSAQYLQPTISGHQLQPAAGIEALLGGGWRRKGQALTLTRLGGSELLNSGSSTGSLRVVTAPAGGGVLRVGVAPQMQISLPPMSGLSPTDPNPAAHLIDVLRPYNDLDRANFLATSGLQGRSLSYAEMLILTGPRWGPVDIKPWWREAIGPTTNYALVNNTWIYYDVLGNVGYGLMAKKVGITPFEANAAAWLVGILPGFDNATSDQVSIDVGYRLYDRVNGDFTRLTEAMIVEELRAAVPSYQATGETIRVVAR